MKMGFPGNYERELSGAIEGIALSHGGAVAFPVILSMNGHILHNHNHEKYHFSKVRFLCYLL